IPQNTALLFSNNLWKIILLSIGFGILGSLIGLIISYVWNIPSGASIIFTLVLIYLVGSVTRNLHTAIRVKRQR
ncbi:MAG: metal ABC transporter permease, partial [Bacteroidales bacterium]|nr:metal ABC transporter permease [Bacteroidales bacterium]